MARKKREPGAPIVIKKYANRRLYNTETSGYVTLDHLAAMIKAGEDFVVRDAKSGEDLTRSVLTQIIFEKESNERNMLPLNFLRQLIAFYGDGLQAMVPGYLQSAMEVLTRNQGELRAALDEGADTGNFLPLFEEIARQNLALFEQSMQLFAMGKRPEPRPEPAAASKEAEIDALKAQLSALKDKVDALSR